MHVKRMLAGGALAAVAMAGGAVVGTTMLGTAGAATTSSTSSGSSASSSAPTAPTNGRAPATPDWSKAGHQANGKTETLLTGTAASKAKAAALAAVPGATAQRVETDADGATYEVHMTKSDGSIVTVKLDSSFKVTQVVNGMA